jgi:hypothetical protein
MAGISSTAMDELNESKIPGKTKPNKYITATIEITIKETG